MLLRFLLGIGSIVIVAGASCDPATLANGENLAVDACNGWAEALGVAGEPPDRSEALAGVREAEELAKRAADADSEYEDLAQDLEAYRIGAEGGSADLLMLAGERLFDQCYEITGAEDELREQIEDLRDNG